MFITFSPTTHEPKIFCLSIASNILIPHYIQTLCEFQLIFVTVIGTGQELLFAISVLALDRKVKDKDIQFPYK